MCQDKMANPFVFNSNAKKKQGIYNMIYKWKQTYGRTFKNHLIKFKEKPEACSDPSPAALNMKTQPSHDRMTARRCHCEILFVFEHMYLNPKYFFIGIPGKKLLYFSHLGKNSKFINKNSQPLNGK
jgi:hypothetical protein